MPGIPRQPKNSRPPQLRTWTRRVPRVADRKSVGAILVTGTAVTIVKAYAGGEPDRAARAGCA